MRAPTSSSSRRVHQRAPAPRGATAVLVAICLVLLCGFLALALDVGHLVSIRGELQNAADSGALSGVRDLDGTTTHLQAAIDSGEHFAKQHATDTQQSVVVATGDVQIGFWDRDKKEFSPYEVDDVTPALASCVTLPCVNAVRARTYRDASHSGVVPLAFAGVLGKTSSQVNSVAVAVTGGPCSVRCIGLPIVLPDCGVNSFFGPPCTGGEYTVLFKNDLTDTAAWADVGSGANTIKCLLQASMTNPNSTACAADSTCKVATDLAQASDVNVINGQVNSACNLITDLYAQHPDYKYVVPIVHATCPEKWVQSFSIVKFATVQIISAPPDCSGTDKSFKVKVLCDQVTNQSDEGGCAAAGTWVATPRLSK